jgi:hypothetical protein
MSEAQLLLAEIERIRGRLWRTVRARQITDERGALRLIRELGFILLMPISGAELPSIHEATRDDWSWWDWKQTLPARKACYYAKILRRRGTFISWPWFPIFRAAYADRRSYHRLFRDGLLDRAEKQILDLLAAQGPLLTTDIRLAFGPRTKQNTRRVKSILVDLQQRFLITAAGGDTEGWSHHRWDLTERWAPARLLAESARISRSEARQKLVARLVHNLVATTPADIAWLFGWPRAEVNVMLAKLTASGQVQSALVPELEGEVIVPRPRPVVPRASRRR